MSALAVANPVNKGWTFTQAFNAFRPTLEANYDLLIKKVCQAFQIKSEELGMLEAREAHRAYEQHEQYMNKMRSAMLQIMAEENRDQKLAWICAFLWVYDFSYFMELFDAYDKAEV